MAAEEITTPQQAVEAIVNALARVEEKFPDSHAVKVLHHRLETGFRTHGHLLGFNDGQISILAGGGTPKLPPPDDGS
jgi:hypothetical protein